MRKEIRNALGVALLVMSGCSGTEADNPSEMIGTATFELAVAPADANCLRISVNGSRSVTRLVDLLPGQATVFSLNGLPLGSVTFTEAAFSLTCGSVTDTSIATWASDPTPATLQAGVAASVTVVLRRNGTANVTSDFQDDTLMCVPPQRVCTSAGMSQCVDVTSNASNCGACGNVCPPVQNAASICAGGACSFICNVSARDCNQNVADGCETNIFNDPFNCGNCGLLCPPGVACQNGACSAPARIQVNPTSVVFPLVPVGAVSMVVPIQIANVGGGPLMLQMTSLGGANPGEFTFFPPPPPLLPPGASTTVQVQFAPIQPGQRSAVLSIRSNDLAQPLVNVQLNGNAL